ncbi:MAG: type II toxin-antitoxin system HicA family toxin [Methylococcaceae bacterium]|nr:type II toxin-antitoxin system HicA family toxin [Methylococcaceae bacterium]MDD1617588.1 type II toxin-antitoxin system HicA family toxin [Methylococcaceae bacterium]
MKSISGKRFAQILESRGWLLVRVNGSHHVYTQSGNPARISLPIHKNEDLKIGLLKHFMKVAGITETEL